MDRDVWMIVMRATRSLGAGPRRRRRAEYADRLILRLYLWLCWNDLPLCRVRDRGAFGGMFRPRRRPSVSQFCKRVAEPGFAERLERVRRKLAGTAAGAALLCIDGKALPVTENTRDPDARTGHGGGRFCKGYRLHAMADDRGRIVEYRVTDMREQEKNMAFEMLAAVKKGQVVLADGNYDSARLYRTAGERGAFLLTPVKGLRRTARPAAGWARGCGPAAPGETTAGCAAVSTRCAARSNAPSPTSRTSPADSAASRRGCEPSRAYNASSPPSSSSTTPDASPDTPPPPPETRNPPWLWLGTAMRR